MSMYGLDLFVQKFLLLGDCLKYDWSLFSFGLKAAYILVLMKNYVEREFHLLMILLFKIETPLSYEYNYKKSCRFYSVLLNPSWLILRKVTSLLYRLCGKTIYFCKRLLIYLLEESLSNIHIIILTCHFYYLI